MKKLWLAAVLLLLMLLVFTGCSGPAEEEPQDQSPAVEDPAEEGEAAEEGLKIAIVTSPSGVDDGSFNEDNYNGILNFIEKHPSASVTPINETTGDVAAAVQAVADVVADYDVIVTPGFQFAGISEIAVNNPEKKFILVDSDPAPVGDQTVFDNIYAMTFAEEESGFFAGITAALESANGKVAVVNGIAFPSNVNYQWGFESGVNYANKHYESSAEVVELPSYAGTDVTGADVGGNYVGNFADPATGKVVANALLAEDVDTVFVAAGFSGMGVFTAAMEAGDTNIIGCDVDQFDDGQYADGNVILTSVLKNMAINVERQLVAIEEGTFKGGNETLRADTDSTGYVSLEGRQQLGEETLEILKEVYDLVKDGQIIPSANFNGYTPEDFPGL
ncbi:MAG: hypothetical protein AVO33_10100 [delta proteobacterium ML8_F1]|nr:MAG: hypothetical protein AVO33_10100 [delta proteobacterium ML8_F1]